MKPETKEKFANLGRKIAKIAPKAAGIAALLGAKEIAAVKMGAGILRAVFGSDDPDQLEPAIEQMTPEQRLALEETTKELRLEELAQVMHADEQVTKRWEIDSTSDSLFTKHFRPGAGTGILVFTAVLTVMSLFVVPSENLLQLMMYWIIMWGGLTTTVVNSYFWGRTAEKKKRIALDGLLNLKATPDGD